jgi:P2-related tail formation protein
MTSAADLLPTSAAPFEIALAKAMTDTLPVPLREAMNPAMAPVNLLPFLAVHDGVRLWFSDWSEARKREVIGASLSDCWLIGVRDGAVRYLAYVDGALVDAVAYPARFVMGRAIIGRTPIGHAPFLARYLVRIATRKSLRSLVMRRGVLGRTRLKTPSREPFQRCLSALRAAKAPETDIRVDFGHSRQIRLSDGVPLDGTYRLGAFISRTKL